MNIKVYKTKQHRPCIHMHECIEAVIEITHVFARMHSDCIECVVFAEVVLLVAISGAVR